MWLYLVSVWQVCPAWPAAAGPADSGRPAHPPAAMVDVGQAEHGAAAEGEPAPVLGEVGQQQCGAGAVGTEAGDSVTAGHSRHVPALQACRTSDS